uniref:Uncharacterized protein n=1 Tax=viral metagenome TaxID=1070528 RepID=A0A6M3JUY5_9ZZZZ
MVKVKYPIKTVKELKKIYPEDPAFHRDLDNNAPGAWDFVSKKLGTLSHLFSSLSKAGFPGR